MRKNKNKRRFINKIAFILCIVFLLILIIFIANKRYMLSLNTFSTEKIQEKPILDDGEINNKYFGIYNDYSNPRKTLQGINEAIEYAAKNNIKYIKLKEGKYLIDGTNETNLSEGIKVDVSNITFDLNNSIIKYVDCNKPSYNIIRLVNVENVVIENGILVGDRANHEYDESTISHDFGCGVSINDSNNIKVINLKIYDMIGDGVYIGTGDKESNNCKVVNNEIYNCRRLGIAVTGGIDIRIENNEVYNIDSVWPKAGIDLEAENNEIIDNILIKNNKIYSTGSSYAVVISRNTRDVLIEDNELNGGIQGLDGKTQINIVNNKIYGNLYFKIEASFQNLGWYVEKLKIEQNEIRNGRITLQDIKKAEVTNNTFINCEFDFNNDKVEFVNNGVE